MGDSKIESKIPTRGEEYMIELKKVYAEYEDLMMVITNLSINASNEKIKSELDLIQKDLFGTFSMICCLGIKQNAIENCKNKLKEY